MKHAERFFSKRLLRFVEKNGYLPCGWELYRWLECDKLERVFKGYTVY